MSTDEFFTIYYKPKQNSVFEINTVNYIKDFLGRECAFGGYFLNIYSDDLVDVKRAEQILRRRGFKITEIPSLKQGAK